MPDPLPGSDRLLVELRDLLAAVPTSLIIVIDGRVGAGKSTLAAGLSVLLDLPVVCSDSYIIAGRKPIEWHHLGLRRLLHRRRGLRQSVIMEGICMGQVLKLIGADPDFVVWVTNERGREHSSDEVEDYISDCEPIDNADFVLTWRQADAPI